MRLRKMSPSQVTVPPASREAILKVVHSHFRRKTDPWLTGLSEVLKKDSHSVCSNANEKALNKFLESEELCRMTNLRLSAAPVNIDLDSIIHRTQRLIHRCLGYDFCVDELLDSGRFGPGSSYACRGSKASAAHKFESSMVTSKARSFVGLLIQRHAPSWCTSLTDSEYASPVLPTCDHGRLSFVPKNDEISRTIIVEPEINTFFQLAIGSMIRKRVKRSFRLDLNSSDKDNRRLAHMSSIDDTLATIDFSSASDTISIELCRLLLPPSWFEVVMLFRTGNVKLPDGSILKLEKVSSMGNGYTWELESLIFHALAVATCDIEDYNSFWCNTFGDDVVIPSGCADQFIKCAEWMGFLVNRQKSFLSGPFRESCGKDYYSGLDVRCIYLRDSTNYVSIINFINQLQRSHHETYKLLARKLVECIPVRLRIWGHRFDGCLWKESSAFKRHSSWEGVLHLHIRQVVKRYPYPNNRFTLLSKVHTLTQDSNDFMSREVSHYIIENVFSPELYA